MTTTTSSTTQPKEADSKQNNRRPAKRRLSNSRRPRDLLVIIPTFVLLLVIVFPVLWMVFTSLRPATALAGNVPWSQYFSGLGFDAYRRLFDGTTFARYILNSVVISCASTVCTIILASIAGYGLSRFRFRLRGFMLFIIMGTQLLPFVVLITPVYTFFSVIGLLNSYVGIIIVYTAMTLPLSIFLTLGYFDTIPRVVDEAARIDGCTTLGVIFRIIVPLSLPGIVTVAVTAFIATWEEFLFATVLLTQDQVKTVQVGLAGYFGEYSTDWGVIMAAATVAAIPTILLFSIVQKRLVAGMAAGSVKE
ncbi:carbohydrate ABC transporter permease [Spelaeicoccus albus]|uniref:ABC-type glycerol-3-phosphate transport system permease component n=1 Tax=Spelaeicoccus albus TaxID=1280376 RepID=A0A7Z0D067_9MICO|nr:carbohydrate ABC transporter permease [Spelaeicoccus albus]NYI66984.1 ABC-type glycerol-3-phosphate transport system permease component [Spelaeicoccus albus]